MELSLLTKLRIIASIAIGATILGFLAWPIIAPADPMTPITTPALSSAIIIAMLALVTGFLAAVVSKPYPLEIGILAVPAGLAVWAWRSGSVGQAMQQTADWQARQHLLMPMRFEPFFWLVIVLIGVAGALAAKKVLPKNNTQIAPKTKINPVNALMAVIASVIIATICIKFLAQSERIGQAVTQPATAQIAFAVFTAFALAAFIIKRFLKCGYIWPALAAAFVNIAAITLYAKQSTIEVMADKYPAICLPTPTLGILPIQMIAFATLGAILGHWVEVRFDYWRKHQMIENPA